MSQVLAIRHVAFEDLGSLAPLLRRRGLEIRYVEAGDGLAGLDADDPKLLLVLGGPIGVYEDADYPFLATELRLIEKRLAAARPVLGICLGCQILAKALGARVFPGPRKEIGWSPLQLTEAGRRSPLRHLGETTAVLHWHGDTFDLPHGAERLASTALYENQAFSLGPAILGLQFHPEVTAAGLEHWLIGHAGEIAATEGTSVADLRSGGRRFAEPLLPAATTLFEEWLGQNGL